MTLYLLTILSCHNYNNLKQELEIVYGLKSGKIKILRNNLYLCTIFRKDYPRKCHLTSISAIFFLFSCHNMCLLKSSHIIWPRMLEINWQLSQNNKEKLDTNKNTRSLCGHKDLQLSWLFQIPCGRSTQWPQLLSHYWLRY